MRILLFLLLVILPFRHAFAIMNGNSTGLQDLIAHTTVQVRTEFDDHHQIGFCSGSVIAEDLVLTAAHCLKASPENTFVVFNAPVGSWRLKFPVKSYVRHEGYSAKEESVEKADQDKSDLEDEQLVDVDDIALIKLKEPLPDGFYPIKLAAPALEFGPDEMLEVAGYGVSKPFSDPIYPEKRKHV